MKTIFLCMIAACTLNTFSFHPFFNKDLKGKVDFVENDDIGCLEENNLKAIDPSFDSSYEVRGSYTYTLYNEDMIFYTGHGDQWYEIRESIRLNDIPQFDWSTVQYLGLIDYCNGNFIREDVYFNSDTGCLEFVLCTRNSRAYGDIIFNYSYMHDPEMETWPDPVDSNGMVHKNWTGFNPDYHEYSSYSVEDGLIDNAHEISKTFKLTGKLKVYSFWDNPFNYYGSVDSNWYRFETTQTYRYTINFKAPNNKYKFYLYKYRPKSQLDYSVYQCMSRSGSFGTTVNLKPATYFLKITVTENQYISDQSYTVNFSTVQTNNQFPIYHNNLKNFNAIIWENDYIPDNIENRWSSLTHELKVQDLAAPVPTWRSGYFDPIFYEKGQGLTTNKTILDSVIYVWGKQPLTFLFDALYTLQETLEKHEKEIMRNKQIAADLKAIGSGLYELALFGVGVHGEITESISSDYISTSDSIAGVGSGFESLAVAIFDLFLGEIPMEFDSFVRQTGMLYMLIGAANGLTGDPKGVLCIPVYGEMDRVVIGNNDTWIYRRSFIPSQKKYKADGYPDSVNRFSNKFEPETIDEIQRISKIVNGSVVETRTYHGSLKTFKSFKTLKKYVNYDYIMEGNI